MGTIIKDKKNNLDVIYKGLEIRECHSVIFWLKEFEENILLCKTTLERKKVFNMLGKNLGLVSNEVTDHKIKLIFTGKSKVYNLLEEPVGDGDFSNEELQTTQAEKIYELSKGIITLQLLGGHSLEITNSDCNEESIHARTNIVFSPYIEGKKTDNDITHMQVKGYIPWYLQW